MKKLLEVNTIRKDRRKVKLRFALCYPNTYMVGMSSLGIRLLYALINLREDVACERFFYEPGKVPRSVESGFKLSEFEVIGVSLQFEEDYVRFIEMILNSGVPLKRWERGERDPIVVAGGICAVENPQPLSDFVDVFVIGDGEALIDRILDICIEERDRETRIEALSNLEGFYVPAYTEGKVKRVWCKNINEIFHPTSQVLPARDSSPVMPVFGRSILLEVARGCEKGCRFCLIGFCNRPKRIRSGRVLEEIVERGVKESATKKVTLIAPSLSEHPNITELCWNMVNSGLEISLPSLSIDVISDELLNALVKGGQRTVTIAPETGTEELRKKINKPFSDDEIISAADTILEQKLNLKMYFIVGLPFEKEEDVEGIVKIVSRISKLRRGTSVKVSVNPFVPKPHTPFAWAPQQPQMVLKEKMKKVRSFLRKESVVFEGMDPRKAAIEAILSLGGRELGEIIELATLYGGGFGAWRRALREKTTNLEDLSKFRSMDAEQPWEVIDVGVSRKFLIKEWYKAVDGVQTSPYSCCDQCGVCYTID
nr:radical SAM protein [Candidatus Bathyarchaeota archaeon]